MGRLLQCNGLTKLSANIVNQLSCKGLPFMRKLSGVRQSKVTSSGVRQSKVKSSVCTDVVNLLRCSVPWCSVLSYSTLFNAGRFYLTTGDSCILKGYCVLKFNRQYNAVAS